MLLYYFDLAGVAVFAASGVLAARDRDLDLLGVIVVAAMQALGTPPALAFWAGMIVVVSLRLLAIRWGLHLPLFRKF